MRPETITQPESEWAISTEAVAFRKRVALARVPVRARKGHRLRDGFAGDCPNCLRLPARQQIERDNVRDHQRGHVDDRNRIGGAQLPGDRRKADVDRVVVIEDQVRCSHEIEPDDEQPK